MKNNYLSKKVFLRLGFGRVVRSLTLLCLMVAASLGVQAQSRTVKGTVTSSDGMTLPGVTLLIEGSSSGAVADVDGNYSMEVPSDNAVIVASFIGYETKKQTVNGRSVIDFSLDIDVETLEEVVVIGYGSVEKSKVTSAISSVDQSVVKNIPVPGIDQAIQGRVAGVNVSTDGGQPGGGVSVSIRGITSIGNTSPLYVVDGVILGDGNSTSMSQDFLGGGVGQTRQSAIAGLNPNDIESIDILKDASAQAIYGSRAANGVILITTKKGKSGQGKITYNTYYGISMIPKKLDVMDLQENARYQASVIDEINAVEGGNPQIVSTELSNPDLLGHGTDWQDEVYQTGSIESHSLSFSGGKNSTNYYLSTGYLDQKGTLIGTGFKRYTARLSVDHDIKEWVSVGYSTNLSRTNQRVGLTDGFDAVTSIVLYNSPLVPVKDVNGDYVGQINVGGTNYGQLSNPVAQAKLRDVRNINTTIFGGLYSDFHILKGLDFKTEVNYNLGFTESKAYQPLETNELFNTNIISPSKLREQRNNSYFLSWRNYLSYNKSFGKHNIYATAGWEVQQSEYNYISGSRNDLKQNLPSLEAGVAENQNIAASAGKTTMESYFGRLNYSFDDRYSLSGVIRRDASSNFGPNNRVGVFPSISGAWTISNESFMGGINFMNLLKLRAGYGEVGNQNVGAANSFVGNVKFFSPSPFGNASRLENIPNPDLRWEAVKTINIGLDMRFVSNRVGLTIDGYKKTTNDMLMSAQLPQYSGIGTNWDDLQSPKTNAGQITNTGIDLTFDAAIIDKGLTWNANMVFSHYKNTIDYLNADNASIDGYFSEYSTRNMIAHSVKGGPVGAFYGYKTDGLYKTDEELNALSTGLDVAPDGLWLGDIRYKDLDGDGDIDNEDVTFIGDPNPDFTLGLTNSFSFKGIDLSIFMYGSFGADAFNYTRRQTESMNNLYSNQLNSVSERYTASNTDATMPRYNQWHDNNRRISDRYIEDGTFVRIQNVELAYNLPLSIIEHAKLTKFRVYMSIQNLATFTKYSGYNPELGTLNSQQTGILMNTDNGRYPVPRTFTIGANIEF